MRNYSGWSIVALAVLASACLSDPPPTEPDPAADPLDAIEAALPAAETRSDFAALHLRCAEIEADMRASGVAEAAPRRVLAWNDRCQVGVRHEMSRRAIEQCRAGEPSALTRDARAGLELLLRRERAVVQTRALWVELDRACAPVAP